MMEEELNRRRIPELLVHNDGQKVTELSWAKRRTELLDLFRQNEYGYAPPAPAKVESKVLKSDENAFAGKAIQQLLQIYFDTPKGEFSFPFTLVVPKKNQPTKTFLLLNFRPDVPDIYCPTEELIDNGYAVAQLYYEDVTTDNVKHTKPLPKIEDCFTDGLCAYYPRDPQTGWGKISMWAWAASRVMDVLCTHPELDNSHVAIVGHSRLGKTALWCSAQDERFSLTVSNDSGCCGAALFRGKQGENIAQMIDHAPYWLCGNFADYVGKEQKIPIDQHMLLGLIAPRGLLVNSATLDAWADPKSEYLSVCAASPAFELLGQQGIQAPNREVLPGECFLNGTIAYCLRDGSHYLSRTDWLNIMQYRTIHNL